MTPLLLWEGLGRVSNKVDEAEHKGEGKPVYCDAFPIVGPSA